MSETAVTTVDYVRAALAGDAFKAKEIFNQLMAPKVVAAIDDKKIEVAQNYFGQQIEVEPSAAEENNDSEHIEQSDADTGNNTEEDADDENA